MKVLFIQPPHYFGANSRPPGAFPLGAGYVAAALAGAGHRIEVFDIYANQLAAESVQSYLDRFNFLDIDAVCISALSTQYRYVKWLVGQLKERTDKPVILGNALATFSAEVVFKNTAVDICVIGEGERTLVELLANLGDLAGIKGIVYREDGRIVFNAPREYIKNLDEIVFPLRDKFAMDIYLKHCCLSSNAEIRAISVITARGCPYECNFCSKTFQGVRLRSVDNIIQEIEQLRSKYDFQGISFSDELTLVNKARTYELCKYLKKAKLAWGCQGRVNVVDLELLKTMRDSGCKSLGFGVESGSQKILDKMNKGICVEDAVKAIKMTKCAGIEPLIQMMHGYPGEDKDTLEETFDFFRKVKSPTMQFSMTTALPGTVLFNDAKKRGLIKDENEYMEKLDWGYYGEREILVNFTKFTDEELVNTRRQLEAKINACYRKYLITHPWIMFGIIFNKIRSYYLRYGLVRTFEKILKFNSYFKKDNWML